MIGVFRSIVPTPQGNRLCLTRFDDDPGSCTVGMWVSADSRPLTLLEEERWAEFTRRIGEAWADPSGTTREATGDVADERDAWLAALPNAETVS